MKFNLHMHAWFDMSRVVFGQFVLLVLLILLSSEWKHFKMCKTNYIFYIVAFLVCQEYPIIYANGRLACLMLACQQNTSHRALAGMRNSSMGPPHEGSIRWPIAPTLLPRSYISLPRGRMIYMHMYRRRNERYADCCCWMRLFQGWGFHGLGSHCPWLLFTTSHHWWQFKCSTIQRWHFCLTPTTLGLNFSQFLLTYGHDSCTKWCIMEHALNALCSSKVSGSFFFGSVYIYVINHFTKRCVMGENIKNYFGRFATINLAWGGGGGLMLSFILSHLLKFDYSVELSKWLLDYRL